MGRSNNLGDKNILPQNNGDVFDKTKDVEPVMDLVRELKLLCHKKQIPMFICLGLYADGKKIKYHYDCVSAALQLNGYGRRIYNLLANVGALDVEYPDRIKQAIQTLQDWMDNELVMTEGINTGNDHFRHMYDIGAGQMKPIVYKEDNEEEAKTTK